MFNTGNPDLLRLFNEPLGGQIVWLLPMALFGILALAWQRRPRPREDRQQQSLILWGTWLLTMAVFFSLATFFHQYYLSTFAPAICALCGIGVVVMWQDYRRSGWRGWLLPIALIVTALVQIHIITSNPTWGTWLIPLIAISCAIAAVILFAARLIPRLRVNSRVLASVLGLALLGLMLTSAVWSTIPVLANEAASLPVAGASGQSNFGGGGERSNVNSALISYLEAHKGNAKYLVAVVSSNEADSIILARNHPVMALGGFSGSDPILTTSQLAALVKSGEVKYFLLNGTGGGGPGGNGQSALITWITQHAKVVSSSQWQSGSTRSSSNGFAGSEQLYEITSTSSSTSSSASTIEAQQEAAIAKIEPAVVELVVTTAQGEQIGSGVIIDSKGDIITNYHIVNGENRITVVLYNGSKEQGQLVGTSTSNDLAVVHIQPFANMTVAQIGNSSSLVVGQEVLAIGNPLGITETATKGIVSAQNRSVTEPTGTTISNAIQTDAAVNPGNSGGALINLQGQLIGIPTLTAVNTESNTAVNGVSFAIPSNLVRTAVQQILQQ